MNAKLADVMPKELKKQARQHDMVEAVFFKKLYNRMDSLDSMAKKIGMTASNVSAILKENKTKRTNELAARYIYEKEYANEGGGQAHDCGADRRIARHQNRQRHCGGNGRAPAHSAQVR